MMRNRPPAFDELIGSDVPTAERERLRGVHELLARADAPPELSPELERVPWPDEALKPLGLIRRPSERHRPWLRVATAVAAIFVIGFFLGQAFTSSSSSSFDVAAVKKMHGTAAVPAATGSIDVGHMAPDGNWPMLVTVTNLPPAQDGYYDLWLSKNGKPVALCGSFNTRAIGDTIVRLSAAYQFRPGRFDGWVVTRHAVGRPEAQSQIVMTT